MSTGTRASRSAVVAALARVEGRELLGHPAFLAGIAFALIGTASFVRADLTQAQVTWEDEGWTVAVAFALVAILTMVATNLAALRDRRSHTVEQHASLPVGGPATIGGLLAAIAWPAAIAAVLLLTVVGFGTARGTNLTDIEVVQLVETICFIPMLGALGIAIGVWVPSPFVVPLLGWALFLFSPGEHPQGWQAVAPFVGLRSAELQAWHLVYVVGLTTAFGIIAIARSSRRHWVLAVGLAALAIIVASAVVLVRNACPIEGACVL